MNQLPLLLWFWLLVTQHRCLKTLLLFAGPTGKLVDDDCLPGLNVALNAGKEVDTYCFANTLVLHNKNRCKAILQAARVANDAIQDKHLSQAQVNPLFSKPLMTWQNLGSLLVCVIMPTRLMSTLCSDGHYVGRPLPFLYRGSDSSQQTFGLGRALSYRTYLKQERLFYHNKQHMSINQFQNSCTTAGSLAKYIKVIIYVYVALVRHASLSQHTQCHICVNGTECRTCKSLLHLPLAWSII